MKSKKIYSFIGSITSFYDLLETLTGYKKSVNYFISQLPFPEDQSIKVLDAGCGTGVYTFSVLNRYKNAYVTAFDINKRLVQYVQKQAEGKGLSDRVYTFTGDLSGPLTEIENETFDLIITAGVFVYVPHEATVRNLSRFLVSGGYFFNSPNRDSIWGKIICKIYACSPYPKEENTLVFENNSFALIKDIKVPSTPTASFKDAHIFRKISS